MKLMIYPTRCFYLQDHSRCISTPIWGCFHKTDPAKGLKKKKKRKILKKKRLLFWKSIDCLEIKSQAAMVAQNASSETRTLRIQGELFNGDAVAHMSHGNRRDFSSSWWSQEYRAVSILPGLVSIARACLLIQRRPLFPRTRRVRAWAAGGLGLRNAFPNKEPQKDDK